MKSLLLLAITVLITTANAQGANPISATHLTPYQAEFDYFIQQEQGQRLKAGYWTDSLTVTDTRIIRTVKRIPKGDNADLVRTVAASKATLAPVYINQRFGKDLESVVLLRTKKTNSSHNGFWLIARYRLDWVLPSLSRA